MSRKLLVSTLLTRRAMVTPKLTAFDSAYYEYHHDLRNAHAREFDASFWTKKSGADEIETVEPAKRETAADLANDMQSLDRKLDANLYYIVKHGCEWGLPTAEVKAEEALHDAAKRGVLAECGRNVDLWFVGRAPIAHAVDKGQKTYFHKAHILAGKPQETTGFKWVTKQEMKDYLAPGSYGQIADLL
ncbi:hypothetical protein RI367_000791 [Sorochytrium milnesiophthora]